MEWLNDMFYWGLSYQDVANMFALDKVDLQRSIVDVMGAPSSFNSTAHEKGQQVITCNDIYGSSKDELQMKISAALQQTMHIIKEYPERFVSTAIGTPKAYATYLKDNLTIFMRDYEEALSQRRYLPEVLPSLDFHSCQFDLAICRHFLFVRENDFDVDFHMTSIQEMCRIASEVRLFPLLNADGSVSKKLPLVMQQLQQQGYDVEVRKVHYELQKGGNAMLRVWHQACALKP